MKIDGVGSSKIINIYNKVSKREQVPQKNNGTDSIEISSAGKSLSSFSVEKDYTSSEKRLEELRNSISQGTYNVNAKLIAQGIVESIKGEK
ncbi:flagellar biosynthesis anti-sigma factor FlgM [Clostridium sp. 19966]|uniref:flagellar biosynthesis anti-sigma factor FlgM n=1 Tax=Clostridium sp. 19966 TaxID=2768166 RepID=UPI0028DE8EEF|nr:flagellar biosynthesis anti-sigma factor FlgM [Clostridium sp. 19966]MDT8716675.1 flagellar biosynthesis anti-sigma factor FlgM [Clostridium sp. 19966]